jgi:tetratricopeptide (TPR) repeat protein
MLYYRGSAYLRRGDYDLAIGDFDQAIKLNPLDVAAWSSRAYAYDAKGDYDRAIQNFDEAIRLGKNSANDWNLRGNSYRHKGDYDRAIQDYDRALELVSMRVDNVGPQFHARFLNNRALAKLAKGDVAGADADFAEAKQIDPQTRCSTSPRNVLVENCLSAGVGR